MKSIVRMNSRRDTNRMLLAKLQKDTKGQETSRESNVHTERGSRHQDLHSPSFNFDGRKKALLQSKGLEILANKLPDERTESDLDILVQMVSGDKFFKTLQLDLRKEICKVAQYEQFEKNEIVFSQGDKGNKFYIILDGAVLVEVTHKSISYIAAELKQGQGFGELALNTDEQRTATIRTAVKTSFMVISRNDYNAILKHLHDKDIQEHLSCFRNVPFFNSWKKQNLLQLLKQSKRMKFNGNQVICKQGEPANYLYVIRSGTCQVLKQIPVPKSAYSKELEMSPTAQTLRNENKKTCFVVADTVRKDNIFGETFMLAQISATNPAGTTTSIDPMKESTCSEEENGRSITTATTNTVQLSNAKSNATATSQTKNHAKMSKKESILNGITEFSNYPGSLVTKTCVEIISIRLTSVMRCASQHQLDTLHAYAEGHKNIYLADQVSQRLTNQMCWEVNKDHVLREVGFNFYPSFLKNNGKLGMRPLPPWKPAHSRAGGSFEYGASPIRRRYSSNTGVKCSKISGNKTVFVQGNNSEETKQFEDKAIRIRLSPSPTR